MQKSVSTGIMAAQINKSPGVFIVIVENFSGKRQAQHRTGR